MNIEGRRKHHAAAECVNRTKRETDASETCLLESCISESNIIYLDLKYIRLLCTDGVLHNILPPTIPMKLSRLQEEIKQNFVTSNCETIPCPSLHVSERA